MNVSPKFHLNFGIFLSTLAGLALAIFGYNVFLNEEAITAPQNIAMLITYVSMMFVAISQFLEMRRKNKELSS